MQLSVVIITFNEEANIGRTLESVQPLVADGKGEIVVVDSGSTDRTVEIAKSFGAKVFVEAWEGFAAQKNSAIDKASGDWILSLDADEEVEPALADEIAARFPSTRPGEAELLERAKQSRYLITRKSVREFKKLGKQKAMTEDGQFAMITGFWIPRKNQFLGRWIQYGGFWPDPKLRFFKKGMARFEDRLVHEDVKLVEGISGRLKSALIHHSYPTLSDYIDHMNRYSSLGAEMVVAKGKVRFSFINILLRPMFTFIYNYFFRLGFLDGREGLLLHLYHAAYVSWKYAKAWELSRQKTTLSS
ncbi:MAG TPA: glycosyltransferase family 2 protein [Candidatus Sulfotelmatobacter sp.]|nr:glycosyltransferase family 2 protein [Candidatus Sulfotelmatobacter sp.]